MTRGRSINSVPKSPQVDFKSLINTIKEVTVHAVTKGELFIEKDLYTTRKSICIGCPELVGTRCSVCGCFINVKASLVAAKCPLRKW